MTSYLQITCCHKKRNKSWNEVGWFSFGLIQWLIFVLIIFYRFRQSKGRRKDGGQEGEGGGGGKGDNPDLTASIHCDCTNMSLLNFLRHSKSSRLLYFFLDLDSLLYVNATTGVGAYVCIGKTCSSVPVFTNPFSRSVAVDYAVTVGRAQVTYSYRTETP